MALRTYYLPLLATMALYISSSTVAWQQEPAPTVLMAPSQTTLASKNSSEALEHAMDEMRAASYYAFVLILELLGDRLPMKGLTFLMPSDEMLAHADATKMDLLMHHTIPRPLTFHDLQYFPTGSLIPSFLPNYMFSVVNHGKRNFTLSNAKIVTPDLCNGSPTIQCHGISSVITDNTIYSTPPSSSINPVLAPHYSSHPPPPFLPNDTVRNQHAPNSAMSPASLQLGNFTSVFNSAVQSPVGNYALILLLVSVGHFMAILDVYWW